MYMEELEKIGLNSSEIKVYLSLLEVGPSSTGPIVLHSKTANSKVYEVLEKLIAKGLVGYFVKNNVKHYKANSPKLLNSYIQEKKETIEEQEKIVKNILPKLLQLQEKEKDEKQAIILSGPKGVKAGFTNLVNELKKGETVNIMGVHDFGKKFKPLALYFQKIRSHKGIKAKFLMNQEAMEIAKKFSSYKPIEIRFLPKEVFTPAIFSIYNDKVIINIAKEMTFFVLQSKSTAQAFNAYFELMWKTAIKKKIKKKI